MRNKLKRIEFRSKHLGHTCLFLQGVMPFKTNPLSEGGAMTTLGRSRVRAGLWLVSRSVSCSFIGWNLGRSSVSLHRSICTMLCSLHNQIIDKNFLTLLDTLAHLSGFWKMSHPMISNYSNSLFTKHNIWCKVFIIFSNKITISLQINLKSFMHFIFL